MCAVPSNFGSDDEVVLATLLALKPEWPIPLSTFFMKYSARNGKKLRLHSVLPCLLGRLLLELRIEFVPRFQQ